MNDPKQPDLPAKGQFLVYQAEDGQVKIDVRLQGETAWLTQAHMSALFQTTVPNVNMHLRNIFAEGELQAGSVIQEFLTTAADGKKYRTNHYNLDAIIHAFLTINDRNILTHAGRISHQMAKELAEAEYDKFNRQRIQQADAAGGEFEKAIKQLPPPPKPKKKGGKK
jgi:hypothetical protein